MVLGDFNVSHTKLDHCDPDSDPVSKICYYLLAVTILFISVQCKTPLKKV